MRRVVDQGRRQGEADGVAAAELDRAWRAHKRLKLRAADGLAAAAVSRRADEVLGQGVPDPVPGPGQSDEVRDEVIVRSADLVAVCIRGGPLVGGTPGDPAQLPARGRQRVMEKLAVEPRAGLEIDWISCSVKDACDIQTGPSGSITRTNRKTTAGTGTAVISAQSIGDFIIDVNRLDWVDKRTAERLRRFRLNLGDIVITRIGPEPRHALVGKDQAGSLLGGSCLRLRAKPGLQSE